MDIFKQAAALLKKWRGTVRPYIENRDVSGVKFDRKGVSPGVEVGDDSTAIHRPGSGKTIPASKAMAANHGFVYAAVKAIADEIAGTDFRLFEVDSDTGDRTEKNEHEILDLLDSVNDFQTGPEFKHMIASHLELTGNAYILLFGVKNFTDKPTALYTLNPGNVKIIIDKTIYPFKISSYEFAIEGKKYRYKPYEIIHLKYPDPQDPYSGIGSVQAIADWIDLDNYGTESNRQYFLRGIRMGRVLETDMTAEAELNALRISFDENHGGVANSHKTTALPKGVKIADEKLNGKDMDFGNMLNMTRDRILAGMRTGKTLLGTAESDTNRSTAETADYVFAKRVIKPKMQLIASYLNERLVPRFGTNIYLSFIDPTPEDKNFRIQEMQAGMGNQPVMSVNEARENYLGLGPIVNGDSVKVGSTMLDIGSPIKEGEGDDKKSVINVIKTAEGKKAMGARIKMPRFSKSAQRREKISADLAEAITKRVLEIKRKGLHEMTHEEYASIYKDFEDRVSKYEKEVETEMLKINADQKEEVIRNIGKIIQNHKDAIKNDEIMDEKSWVAAIIDALTPKMRSLAKSEGEIAATAVGVAGINVLEDEAASKALDKALEAMAKSYTQTTIDQLKDAIGAGLKEGDGIAAITDRVSEVFEFADQTRAGVVARTETFRVANGATKEGWKQSGVVKTIKWYTAKDEDVCQYCEELDGKVINVDDNFFDLGDSAKGSDGDSYAIDYADVEAPPLHPDCRCYTQPEDVSLT